MPRRRRLVLVGAAALALAPAGQATAPGKNGRLTFMRKDAAGHWQIWTATAAGGNAKQLTRGAFDSGWPVWSEDGKKIAFDSSRAGGKHVNDIFVMNADGSGITKLTDSKGESADAAWSPDGKAIAFDRAGQGIDVMDADGGHVRRVTNGPTDLAPRFSPDGKRLVFTRYRGSGRSEKAALFTVRDDGTALRQVTSFAIHAGDADWSPDGTRIVFEAYPTPDAYGDVYVVAASGGRPRNLTKNPVGQAGSADPVWSPDGTRILFLDNRRVNGIGRTGLATIRPDGTGRRFLTTDNVESHQPDWETVR
jgi:Tol biopolymer transport system component